MHTYYTQLLDTSSAQCTHITHNLWIHQVHSAHILHTTYGYIKCTMHTYYTQLMDTSSAHILHTTYGYIKCTHIFRSYCSLGPTLGCICPNMISLS